MSRRILDKNHNPRKGTETDNPRKTAIHGHWEIRTIIPARGRKQRLFLLAILADSCGDKNHNPRKGTETYIGRACCFLVVFR